MERFDRAEPKCVCIDCKTPVCYMYEVIRNDYQCQSGGAYFVAKVSNIYPGEHIQKHFISGHYVIQDVYCVKCGH